jgi:hypothetical protein
MGTGFVTLTHSVGRLMECRSRGVVSLQAAKELAAQLSALLEPVQGPILVVADARNTEPFKDEIAQRIRGALEQMNPKVERGAILVGGRPLYDVQIEAILLASRHPRERTFREVEDLIAFLSETATPEERRRTEQFFAEWNEESWLHS